MTYRCLFDYEASSVYSGYVIMVMAVQRKSSWCVDTFQKTRVKNMKKCIYVIQNACIDQKVSSTDHR